MKVSDNGLLFIKNEEGSKNKAYRDAGGLLTIGCGHLIRPNEQNLKNIILTDQQILDLLKNDIETAENAINNFVKLPLTQNQFDALASLTFNIGDGALKSSSLLRKLNTNPNDKRIIVVADISEPGNLWMKQQLQLIGKNFLNTIQYSFLVWHKVKHQPNQDLYNRRNREYKFYSTQ